MVCTTESAGACVRVRAGESLGVLCVLWGGLGVCESLGRQEGRRREGAQDGKEVQHVTGREHALILRTQKRTLRSVGHSCTLLSSIPISSPLPPPLPCLKVSHTHSYSPHAFQADRGRVVESVLFGVEGKKIHTKDSLGGRR